MMEVQKKPRKKVEEKWVSSQEAADIISANSGRDEARPVSLDYVRLLGNSGKIEVWKVGKRMKLYKRSDVEKIRVSQYKKDS